MISGVTGYPSSTRSCNTRVIDTTLVLLELAGFAALLLWGVHMVQTGVERTFGPRLRHFLAGGCKSILNNDLDASDRLKVYDRGVDVSTDPSGLSSTGACNSSTSSTYAAGHCGWISRFSP